MYVLSADKKSVVFFSAYMFLEVIRVHQCSGF